MAVDVGSAKGYLDLDISGFLAGLRSAQSEADTQTKNIAQKVGKNLKSAGKSLTSAGKSLTKTVTVPIVGAGTAIVKLSSDFESAMSKVSAISGATGSDLEALNKKAQEMGATTKFSATEAAEAFTYMAMAGWDTEAMLAGIDGIMSLAAADGLDLATTSDIVTDALTAFGLSASDSAHFADVLAAASSSANTNVSMLGESFKYVAPVAGALGYSVEDVSVALGLMANAGIKGSQGGTALRASLSRLIKPTDEAAALMDEYNLSLTNSDGTMKSLGEVMDMLRGNLGDLTEAEQAQIAAELFGQEAMSGMLAIINASDKDYENLINRIYDADGAAQQMADTMLNNLGGQITILKSALEGLALQFGEILLPYVKDFTEWIQNLIQKLQELTPEQKEQIVKWGAIAAAIGPIILILGKIVSGVGSVMTAFGDMSAGFKAVKGGGKAAAGMFSKLGGVIGGLSAPMVAIIAVIALVIAAFVDLWKNNEEFRNNIIAIWDQVKATFEKLTSGIVDRLNALGFDFENIGEVLKAIWKGFCDFLAPIFEGVFQYVADTFEFIVNRILNIFDFFVALFSGDWEGVWDSIKQFFVDTWNYIVDTFTNIWDVIIGILDTVCGWFGTTWEDTWNSISEFFVNTWNSISEFFISIWDGISTFVAGALDAIKTKFESIWSDVSSFVINAWETIKNVVDIGIKFIASILDAAFKIITLPFAFIWENCKDEIISAWDYIKTTVSDAINVISKFISNEWDKIKQSLQNVLNIISKFFSDTWNNIKNKILDKINEISSGITDKFNSVKSFISDTFNNIKTTMTGKIDEARATVTTTINSIKTVFSDRFKTIKDNVSTIFGNIKTGISDKLTEAKNAASPILDNISSTISDKFTAAKDAASTIFEGLKTAISDKITAAKDVVSGIIDDIKGFFDFEFEWPDIKMPHFGISPSGWKIGDLLKGDIPTLGIEWYAKAMNSPMLLTKPTIFGYNPATGQLLGGGEAGNEVVAGANTLMGMIRHAVNEAISPIISISYRLANTAAELGYVTHNGFVKQTQLIDKVINSNGTSKGDTFIFNSPKPIDEIEAAKQMKKTKRELAEGF